MSTNVGAVDFELLLNSNPFNKGLKSATNTIKSSGIENSLKNIGKLALAAFSVKAIVNFGKECINLGSDLAEVQNVVDVTFGNLNTEVNKFAENAIDKFGLGQTVTKGVSAASANDTAKEVGIMFRSKRTDGKYRYVALTRGKFVEPSESFATESDSVSPQTMTLTFTGIPLQCNGIYKITADEGESGLPSDYLKNFFQEMKWKLPEGD